MSAFTPPFGAWREGQGSVPRPAALHLLLLLLLSFQRAIGPVHHDPWLEQQSSILRHTRGSEGKQAAKWQKGSPDITQPSPFHQRK